MFGFSALTEVPFASLPTGRISVSLTEGLTASESQDVSLNISTVLTEVISASETQTVVLNVSAILIEAINTSDDLVCTMNINTGLVETVTSIDSPAVSELQMFVNINEVVYAVDAITQRLLWEPIDDTQNPNWTPINTE